MQKAFSCNKPYWTNIYAIHRYILGILNEEILEVEILFSS